MEDLMGEEIRVGDRIVFVGAGLQMARVISIAEGSIRVLTVEGGCLGRHKTLRQTVLRVERFPFDVEALFAGDAAGKKIGKVK